MKLTTTLMTGAIVAAGALTLSTSAMAVSAGGGSDPFDEYAEDGGVPTISEQAGGSCAIYRPVDVEPGTPLVVWGNGTGGSPATYGQGLEHWASYGIAVAAAQTANAGSGEDILDCIDAVRRESYADKIDFSRIGASGHSQGGGGTIMAGRDERITATAPIQPYVMGLGHRSSSQEQQHGPMLILTGSADTLAGPARNGGRVFSNTNEPAFWADRKGASHFEPTGDFGDYRGISTAWWLFQLKDDSDAADIFTGPCNGCDASDWDVETKGGL
ncbi:MAG: alpha/beta hydrolase [Marinobacter sp.]